MKDMELDQYIEITVSTSCRPGASTIIEDKYDGIKGDIQVTGNNQQARFVGPTFKISEPLCIMTNLEVLDEDGKPSTNLTVSMEDRIVKPKWINKSGWLGDYNFTLKATISGGDFTITSKKTLRVVGQEELGEIERIEAVKQAELIKAQIE